MSLLDYTDRLAHFVEVRCLRVGRKWPADGQNGAALLHFQHEVGIAVLFIVSLVAFTISLVEFAREVRIALNQFDHY